MHISVLKNEVLGYLDPKPNQNFIDATINGGGHSKAILEKTAPQGKVLGIDRDEKIIERLKFQVSSFKFQDNLILICDNFDNLKEIVIREKFGPVAGVFFDLGMSSWQIKQSGRGFSFQQDEWLDMRYNSQDSTRSNALEIINRWSEKKIRQILKEYGEERFNQRIAQEIVRARGARPIERTFQLVEIIYRAVPTKYQRQRIHPATKTFQALRMAVNDELGSLQRALPQALEVLSPGGRLAVISFHSLEDRIIKNFFRQNKIKILTKKPIRPSREELRQNPSSRSARLRAAMKL